MAENTNSENNDSSGFLGLVWAGLLCYGAYKLLTSKSDGSDSNSRKHLSEYDIKDIVNDYFHSMSDDEIMMTCFTSMIPDILNVKKDHYDEMLFNRLCGINNSIKSMIQANYDAYKPQLGDSDFKNLIYFLRNDCYNEIKATKFLYQLEGKFMSLLPGQSLFGKAKKASIDYKVLKAIKKGISEYFSALYVYGTSIDVAQERLKNRYVNVFYDALD